MKKSKAFFIFVVILLFIGFFYRNTLTMKEGANVFDSNYYTDYHSQLSSFLSQSPQFQAVKNSASTPFNKKIEQLILHLNQPLGSPEQQRHVHETYVSQMREALQLLSSIPSENNQASLSLLTALTQWIYLQANLRTATANYFNLLSIEAANVDLSNLLTTLQNLRHSGQFLGLQHEADHTEDQYLHGNLPFLVFTLANPQATKVIRMGYPMDSFNKYHLPWVKPAIYPEFQHFLANQSGHLYVNLMKRKGMESPGSRALEELENQIPTYFAVTLDKNSDFYLQAEKTYPENMLSSEFKQLFLRHLINKKGNFYWSKKLDRKTWTQHLLTLLNETHQRYFLDQPSLNRAERLDFIEISYLSILDKLVEELKPTSLNITCRQCMDRGPSLYVLWMLQKNQLTVQELPGLLLAPPLLIHNRASHPARIKRFISAAHRISSFQ